MACHQDITASSGKETAHNIASSDNDSVCKLAEKLTQVQLKVKLLLQGHTSATGLSS